MKNGKPLDQLTKEELIEKVTKGREYYLKLTKSIETLTAAYDLIPLGPGKEPE